MARTIRVDDEVYAWLRGQARPFEDTPNSVLRRVAGLDEIEPQQATAPRPRIETDAPRAAQQTGRQGESVMSTRKFDDIDRARTISAIEEHLGIKLKKIASRRKFLVDQTGSPYWIFGGYEDWHGFPGKMIADAQERDSNGTLVIARRTKTKIKIYQAALQPLLRNADKLHVNKAGDRQFNLIWKGGHVYIKEAPEIHFTPLTEIEYSEEEKEDDRRVKEIKKFLAALSKEDRAALLNTLERDSS